MNHHERRTTNPDKIGQWWLGGGRPAEHLAWWRATGLRKRVAARRLPPHGGYGCMTEYAVARAFTDGRVRTIHRGTTEIMKEIIGRSPLG